MYTYNASQIAYSFSLGTSTICTKHRFSIIYRKCPRSVLVSIKLLTKFDDFRNIRFCPDLKTSDIVVRWVGLRYPGRTLYTYTQIHTYIILHTYIRTYILHTMIHTYMHITYVCTCIHTEYVHIHAHVHTYVHAYMHTYVLTLD